MKYFQGFFLNLLFFWNDNKLQCGVTPLLAETRLKNCLGDSLKAQFKKERQGHSSACPLLHGEIASIRPCSTLFNYCISMI